MMPEEHDRIDLEDLETYFRDCTNWIRYCGDRKDWGGMQQIIAALYKRTWDVSLHMCYFKSRIGMITGAIVVGLIYVIPSLLALRLMQLRDRGIFNSGVK